jgi:hypothetical protein
VLAAHTASFLKFINTVLEDTSRGVASPHHLHNVRCGVENIMSLLKYNDDVVEKADQLSRRACIRVVPGAGLVHEARGNASSDHVRLMALEMASIWLRRAEKAEHLHPDTPQGLDRRGS